MAKKRLVLLISLVSHHCVSEALIQFPLLYRHLVVKRSQHHLLEKNVFTHLGGKKTKLFQSNII